MFVPKPATYISYEQTASITFSRVGGAISASRTFDITIHMKGGAGESQFSNINREEQKPLEDFFKTKGLRVKNEMDEDGSALLAAALRDDPDMASSDEEVVAARADRGSADEDSESQDEDFQTGSESDVAEEYDSAHESSGSGSGEEDGGGSDEEEEAARPKKKAKTEK
jgi:structure-specific recognition protein 1